MHFTNFLCLGPSMNGGLYNCYSYIPKDVDKFIEDVASLKKDNIILPPENFDVDKVITVWRVFSQKANNFKYLLFVIPFAIVPIVYSTGVIVFTIVIITAVASAALGLYRHYQASLQVKIWPGLNFTINKIKDSLLIIEVNNAFKECVMHFTSMKRDNDIEFIHAFFDEEKNPLVKIQSQEAIVVGTDLVFHFYPQLKGDYERLKEHLSSPIISMLLKEKIETFIKAYSARDVTELKKIFTS